MKIGLIDVDGHNFPNFALMRLSAYHKGIGDSVEWVDCGLFGKHYDKVMASKIFTFTDDYEYSYLDCDELVKGGTGYDIKSKLPIDIEHSFAMDYTLYPEYSFSIQFFSRGCIRHCPFCLVHDKEGGIHSVKPSDLNPKGEWIEVLDNNFFANPNWHEAVDYLIENKQPINLHGVDVRIMNEEQSYYLNKLRLKRNIHIAWDLPQLDLEDRIKELLKHFSHNKVTCYVLIGFNSTIDQDLHRLDICKKYGITPFVQPYRDFENKRKPTQYEQDLARWANKMWIFKTCDFKDFSPRKGFKCNYYLK